MEYGQCFNENSYPTNTENVCENTLVYNDNFNRYIGYSDNELTKLLFSIPNLTKISKKITQLLDGLDPEGRPIIIHLDTVGMVLSSVYCNFRPPTGDIYARYNILAPTQQINYFQQIVNETIEIIVSANRNQIETIINNNKLTVWTTLLGDFNEHGLSSHSIIKTREKRPDPFQFNMNY